MSPLSAKAGTKMKAIGKACEPFINEKKSRSLTQMSTAIAVRIMAVVSLLVVAYALYFGQTV